MKHPIQPIEEVDGIPRYKKNAIVEFLLKNGGFDMNALAVMGFSSEDREQFAQLIGYSVSGFGDLSYASPEVVRASDIAVEEMSRAGATGWRVRDGTGYWRKIGVVGVDSGQLMVTDPCYVNSQWKPESDNEAVGTFSYSGCCETTMQEGQAGQLNYELGHAGVGVVFSSGFGDGVYDVFARYSDFDEWGTRIAEVRVILIEDSDDPPDADDD